MQNTNPSTMLTIMSKYSKLERVVSGGEIHLMPVETEMTMPEYGAVDQVEFETKDADFLNQAKSRLDEVEIPYQTLEQDDIESIRITENSGLSFIFTLQK